MKPSKLVALVDWNTGGHHYTWFRGFCRALLETGCQVAVFCPDPDDVRNCLAGSVEGALTPDRICFYELKVPRLLNVHPSGLRLKLQPYLMALRFKRDLAKAEAGFGKKVDLIFLACMYEWEQHFVRCLIGAARRPWSGLNIHARITEAALRGHLSITMLELMRHPLLRSLAVIDEETDVLISQTLKKPVFVFPDFTDETWQPEHPLERRFRRFAADSSLVLSIGHLRQNKGTGTLAQITTHPAATGLTFAFAGQVDWNKLDPQTKEHLERAMTAAPGAIFHFGHIPDGPTYNAMIRACDILYAAYNDFAHSSNTLTKAAVFEKPLIVSEGHLMAHRVRKYKMGEIIPQGDFKALLGAVQSIHQNRAAWLEKNRPRWKEYREAHSYNALLKVFPRLLEA